MPNRSLPFYTSPLGQGQNGRQRRAAVSVVVASDLRPSPGVSCRVWTPPGSGAGEGPLAPPGLQQPAAGTSPIRNATSQFLCHAEAGTGSHRPRPVTASGHVVLAPQRSNKGNSHPPFRAETQKGLEMPPGHTTRVGAQVCLSPEELSTVHSCLTGTLASCRRGIPEPEVCQLNFTCIG